MDMYNYTGDFLNSSSVVTSSSKPFVNCSAFPFINCSHGIVTEHVDHTLPESLIENVEEDLFSLVIGRFVLPLICMFGIVGIVLTVIVLSQKNMTTSTNSYLLALSIADLLFLIMLLTVWVDLFLERESAEQYTFEIYAVIMTVFTQIFLNASIWLTVMLAIERYVAICLPYLAPKVCTVRRARIIIVIIYILSFLVHIPIFFEYEISTEYDEDNHQTITYMRVTDFATNELYVEIYPWIVDGAIQSIVPFLLLLLLNARLIWELRKSTKYIKRNLHVTGINYAQREELQVTLMLVIIVMVFFICQAPYVIYTAIVSINHYHIESAEFTQFHAATKLLLTLKSAANFILYCWFSERFASSLRRLCRRGKSRCSSCGGDVLNTSSMNGNGNSSYYSRAIGSKRNTSYHEGDAQDYDISHALLDRSINNRTASKSSPSADKKRICATDSLPILLVGMSSISNNAEDGDKTASLPTSPTMQDNNNSIKDVA